MGRPKAGRARAVRLIGTTLILGGLLVVWMFFEWESRLEERGAEPLVRPSLLKNTQLVGGLRIFFFQYFVQSGAFLVVPLFLSVSLGLSAIDTGVRLLPLSVTLPIAAAGIPRFRPDANPRRVVRLALIAMFAGTVVLLAAIDEEASAEIVTLPLLLLGLGIGGLASQLGSVAVSAVPDELSPEVGGLQNTATNLGASLGTALAGSVLIASLTATLLTGIDQNPAVPPEVRQRADVQLASGVPFLSDADLESALDEAGVTGERLRRSSGRTRRPACARFEVRLPSSRSSPRWPCSSLGGIPTRQPGSAAADAVRGPPGLDQALA
jgi:hypothetical protein